MSDKKTRLIELNKLYKLIKYTHIKNIIEYTIFCGIFFPADTVFADAAVNPVRAKNGMVATQQYLATKAGLEVLKEGGNAVDAAVTIGFTLAVTLPSAGNLGGGGFMLMHLADTNETIAIDYREKAPGRAYRDMFLGDDGDHLGSELGLLAMWALQLLVELLGPIQPHEHGQ